VTSGSCRPRGPEPAATRYALKVVLLIPDRQRLRMTLSLNVAVPVLPLESPAEHATGVAPTRKRLPDGGLHVTGTSPSTLSAAFT
jgi:hypothetical protein